MALRVEISRRETIKPLSPHPSKLHNLTILDQKTPSVYVPICLFYPPNVNNDDDNIAEALKSSLSQTLDAYYPLAGRYKDAFSIECNDEGVEFVEGYVIGGGEMLDALREPDEDRLLALLPCPPRERHVDLEGRLVLLAVQLTRFDCGGVAIGVCMWHGVADACTLACFLRAWSTVQSSRAAGLVGEPVTSGRVVVDCTSIFPPTRIHTTLAVKSSSTTITTAPPPAPKTKVKRFLFKGLQITALRSRIQSCWQQKRRPTRVEAVSALVWAAVIRDKKKKQRETVICGDEEEHHFHHHHHHHHHHHQACMMVNLRSRMVPPLAEQVMGSLVVLVPVLAKWPQSCKKNNRIVEKEEEEEEEEEEEDGNELLLAQLAEKLREAVGMWNDDQSVRKIFGGSSVEGDIPDEGGYSDLVGRVVEAHRKENLVAFSSWCRFPFYETEFGWGKPTWVGYFNMADNFVVLIDSEDGEGIEAWVSLSEEEMNKFQNNPAIAQYAHFKS